MDELVKKLVSGKHSIIFEPKTKELSEIKERLNRGFVFVKFLETDGETELGINLDNKLSLLGDADFNSGIGNLRLVGTCELNFIKVRCIAEIDLATRQGKGSLELLNEKLN